MTTFQRIIKYLAMALAIFLAVNIVGGLLAVAGFFGGLFENHRVTDNLQTYEVSSDIRRLQVEIPAADFVIQQGERFLVESNLENLTVEEQNGALSIREKSGFGINDTDAVLTLFIPPDAVFEKVSIQTGAGKLTVDQLSADTMHLALGAGAATMASLTAASRAEIEGGAGKITISGGSLSNLDLGMGVGQLHLTSALKGDCELDLGIGESNITVLGDREHYDLDIEKGIGMITVDGENVSDQKEQENRDNRLEISGGIGAIRLAFQ